jgi:hypothetical protein
MKIIFGGIVAGLLLCTAAVTGEYYVGKSAKPVSRVWVARANASREYFIRTLIEVKADLSEVLTNRSAV